MTSSALATATAAATQPRRSLWEIILASTPVFLTVLATVLAGLSSSEMTQAQYYRSLAAQFQSKAGDQWGFFQAKRIRGTSLETTVDLLHAVSEPGPVNPLALKALATLLERELQRAGSEAHRVQETLAAARDRFGTAGEALQPAVDQLVHTIEGQTREAATAKAQVEQVLAGKAVQDAFEYLNTKKVPMAKELPIENPSIRAALSAIEERQPETETAPLIVVIPDNLLQQATQMAEANLKAFEGADQPISAELQRIGQLVQEQVALARPVQRALRELNTILADPPLGESKDYPALASAAAALSRTTARVKAAVDELNNDFRAARHGYTARRYRNEARYNQTAAELYELQVRKSDLRSERHRIRSRQFFYCMLTAQAGVTIATLSLAMRYKNLLWILASLAGLGAVSFSFYVYSYM